MGALHLGHQRLIEKSVNENDITICSIFVNPTQFNNPIDLKNYPRDIESDIKLLEPTGCNVVFIPEVHEIYCDPAFVSISFGKLESTMEGYFRPGHFKGVGIIVAKLFNVVNPDRAYFGQKDLQQLAIIKSLTRELNFNINIISVETVREIDGLAMSSRNRLLTEYERNTALTLYSSLLQAKEYLLKGWSPADVRSAMFKIFAEKNNIKLEYFEIVNSETLESIENIESFKEISLCVAAHVGKVRLIDNMSLY